jgi:hypothetical protein
MWLKCRQSNAHIGPKVAARERERGAPLMLAHFTLFEHGVLGVRSTYDEQPIPTILTTSQATQWDGNGNVGVCDYLWRHTTILCRQFYGCLHWANVQCNCGSATCRTPVQNKWGSNYKATKYPTAVNNDNCSWDGIEMIRYSVFFSVLF